MIRWWVVTAVLLLAGGLLACGGAETAGVADLAIATAVPNVMVMATTVPATGTPLTVAEATNGEDAARHAAVAAAIDRQVQDTVADGRFAGTVLVARDGMVLLKKGYGPAEVIGDGSDAADAVYYIASLTKQFTAAAILQLQEAGRLSVDDSLAVYVPDFPHAGRITLHQLLNHTAGVFDYTAAPGFQQTAGRPHSVDELIATFAGRGLEFEPGTQFAYSNSNYILLGKVIEVVSGQSYGDYVTDQLFGPLGMRRSGYGRGADVLPNVATGYQRARGGGYEVATPVDMSVPYAAGAIYATTGDLYTWDRALRSGALLAPASVAAMFSGEGIGYGYGWNLGVSDGRRIAFHGGWIPGYASHIVRWLDDDAVLIVLSNVENTPVRPLVEELKPHLFADGR